jgi:ATP-dependent DNA helicase RecG
MAGGASFGGTGRPYTRAIASRVASRAAPAGFAGSEAVPRARRVADLELSVEVLPGVGPKVAERLGRLGLHTVRDLCEYLPRTFLDWHEATAFRELAVGQEATVECSVERVSVRPTRRRNLRIVEAIVADRFGGRAAAVWFNQAWLAEILAPGTRLLLHGRLEGGRGLPSFRVERHEVADGGGLRTLGLVPLYAASQDVSTTKLLEITERALDRGRFAPDPLPVRVLADERLPARADALRAAHRPRARDEHERGRERLAFEELLVLVLGLRRRRRDADAAATAPSLGEPGELLARYRAALPFVLTPEQETAIVELDHDLARERPMQRLLQGDVGSGKTVVALWALLRAVERGHQAALMAPTETLAEQHFLTIETLCRDLGVRCELLTSSLRGSRHARARGLIASGEAEIAVGTHALIQPDVGFRSLAVAVVDEQHRFGVEQRRALGARFPHVLHMTATPIPRTIAQTVYGDLDVTEIVRPPRDRKPVKTTWIAHDRAPEAYTRLRRLLEEGRQAYVVCPLVSESETVEARAAEQEAERLGRGELAGYRVGCLHGRLRADERRRVMGAFTRRELDVLVATTVIEVGIDVPNATVMIVQEADRFGLAQLHQLRGRVGRGAEQSYCLLVSRPRDELTEDAQRRLEALVEIRDGFRLAAVDLELRGEGQLFGTRQSGLPDLRFASLARDARLVARARRWASLLLDADTDLVQPLDHEVERFFADEDRRGFA